MKKRVTVLGIVASLAILTGCGSSNSNNNGAIGGIGGGLIGGCLPITSQIGFTGTNIYFDANNIRGGLNPSTQQSIGQMSVTTSAVGGPYQRQGVDGTFSMNVVPVNQNPYGNQYGGGYSQISTTANVTGFIALNQMVQQDIMYKFGNGAMTNYGSQYGTGFGYGALPYANTATPVCVSGIAIDIGHTYNGTQIYGGQAFLYLNNTQHGYVIYP